jgi:hypothetical protein
MFVWKKMNKITTVDRHFFRGDILFVSWAVLGLGREGIVERVTSELRW